MALAASINVSLEEMGVLDALRARVAKLEDRHPILERLAAYLTERRRQGFALPDEVHALLDELQQFDAKCKEEA